MGGGMREAQAFDTRNVIDMLKCKKYIECSHGYGVLFKMHHWRIWLKYVMLIYKELHTEKDDGGSGSRSNATSRRPSGRGLSGLGLNAANNMKRTSSDEEMAGGTASDTNNFMSVDGVSLKK